jgi:hypothetical protein
LLCIEDSCTVCAQRSDLDADGDLPRRVIVPAVKPNVRLNAVNRRVIRFLLSLITARTMSVVAILGATGQTGGELVKLLLPRDDVTLHVYARSAVRLRMKHPSLASASNARVFIGDLDDRANLDACLRDADYILSAVAQNRNEPGCSVAQRTAAALVGSLERSRKAAGATAWRFPTLVFLTSGAVDPRTKGTKAEGPWLLHQANHHIYLDLELSIAYLRQFDWLRLVLASPGGLVHDDSRGVKLTEAPFGTPGGGSQMNSYADLALAMVQMSEDDKYVGKQVGFIVQGPVSGLAGLALLRYGTRS